MNWKHSLGAVASICLLAFFPILTYMQFSSAAAGETVPEGFVSCVPEGGEVVCTLLDGTVVGNVPLPTVQVPGPTVQLPRPPQVTVTLPEETVTVRPPRATVTVQEPQQPRETVTVRPDNPGRSEAPRPTETVTVTESPTGQTTAPSDTVTPSPEVRRETETKTQNKTETTVKRVALGLLASLVLAGLGMLALYLGFILGHKSAERSEDKFLKSLVSVIRSGKRF